jgi:hypothetical protein
MASNPSGSGIIRQSARPPKPNLRHQIEPSENANKSATTTTPVKIPDLDWASFPQSTVAETLFSKKGKPFRGQYVLLDLLKSSDIDPDKFYDDNPRSRWAIICSSDKLALQGDQPLVNPFQVSGKTFQAIVSSLWISKCGRFFVYPDPKFQFEDEENDNESVWMPSTTFTEYHLLPKSESKLPFANRKFPYHHFIHQQHQILKFSIFSSNFVGFGIGKAETSSQTTPRCIVVRRWASLDETAA